MQYDYSKQGNPKYKAFKDVGRSNAEISRETYNWNDRDELIAINGRVTMNFEYDNNGLRVKKTITKPSSPNPVIEEYQYLYSRVNNQPVFKYNKELDQYDIFTYDPTGKRIMRTRVDKTGNVQNERFINDYQGSPVAVVDDAQTIKYQTYNDPWGNLEMSVGAPSSNPEFKYTDKEQDEDSGLYYFQARYMDPITGRFLGRDESKIENSIRDYFHLNDFQFCMNNPIKNVDPDGDKGVAVMSGTEYREVGGYKYYKTSIYPNLTLKDYNAAKASGKLSSFKPKAEVYLSRDAEGAKLHSNDKYNYGNYPDESKFGSKREAPNATYILSPGVDANHILMSTDTWGSGVSNGPDGKRYGLNIHQYSPEFSLGCPTTGEFPAKGDKGQTKTMSTIRKYLPDIKKEKDPAYLIKEPLK